MANVKTVNDGIQPDAGVRNETGLLVPLRTVGGLPIAAGVPISHPPANPRRLRGGLVPGPGVADSEFLPAADYLSQWRGEDLAHAAARELHEEVGLKMPPGVLRPYADYCIRHEFTRDTIRLFEVDWEMVSHEPPVIRVDHREVVWAGFPTCEAALAMGLFPLVERYLFENV